MGKLFRVGQLAFSLLIIINLGPYHYGLRRRKSPFFHFQSLMD